MNNNYLLIDYGNSFIKAAIYSLDQDEIIETRQIARGKSARDLFRLFRYLGDRRPNKVVVSASPSVNVVGPFLEDIKKLLNASIIIVGKPEFMNLIDLSNIKPNVFIGPDIYACSYKAIQMFDNQPALVVSLGTAYFAVVVNQKKIESCFLLPSLTKGMETIAKLTNIPNDYIPEMYDKNKGLNTPNAFASGANVCIEGFVDNIVKMHNIDPKNVILTGGDVFRYTNIKKKYKEVKNFVLTGLAALIKEKKW
ncbi:MAG: type III pantothenate kinase [Mycoplasma sp.]|nr:type III pantothenate kinase [Candidatus Hennigella equi]